MEFDIASVNTSADRWWLTRHDSSPRVAAKFRAARSSLVRRRPQDLARTQGAVASLRDLLLAHLQHPNSRLAPMESAWLGLAIRSHAFVQSSTFGEPGGTFVPSTVVSRS